MIPKNRIFNLVLGGGGVKGISYIGMFEAAEQRGIKWGNIAGVSAGALAGSFAAAGYNSIELKNIMYGFDFGKIEMEEVQRRVPLVSMYMDARSRYRYDGKEFFDQFVESHLVANRHYLEDLQSEDFSFRGNLLGNIVSFSKAGCLLDGDYLEEWVFNVLRARDIRTFGDLRGGIVDKVNPRGYRARMTAVDANRGRVIVLPDDIAFYGVDPDRLEVARAVRMSTSVPFAFKPVELKKREGNIIRTYHIVDGGVLDGMPYWLIKNSGVVPLIGFKLKGSNKNKLLSIDTPLNILKALISAVHDIGVPHQPVKPKYIAAINTPKVSFLDFSLSDEEKEYLYVTGKNTARWFFANLSTRGLNRIGIVNMLRRLLGIRYYGN